MVKRMEPILLYGFDFEIQSTQVFDVAWGSAWLTSQYTDESHEMWDQVTDPAKRREIKYGNNIAVLFTAMVHCGEYYHDQEDWWRAIASGFNTGHERARDMANLLVDARRAQRFKRSKDASGTARAADRWIEFIDARRNSRATNYHSDTTIKKHAQVYYAGQHKKWLNAAWVPITNSDSRNVLPPPGQRSPPRPISSLLRSPPRGPSGRRPLPPPAPPSPSVFIKNEPLPPPSPGVGRKRGASLTLEDRSHKRYTTGSVGTRSTERVSTSAITAVNNKLQLPSPVTPNPELHTLSTVDGPGLQARIALESLEKGLSETRAKIQTREAVKAVATLPSNQSREAADAITPKDMATVVNIVGTIKESMHSFMDRFHRVENEVSGLKQTQNDMKTSISQQSGSAQSLSSVVETLQRLGEQLTQVQQRYKPPVDTGGPTNDSEDLRALLKDQGNRVDRLAQEMGSGMAELRRLQQQTQSITRGPPAQSLQQALAAAERDLQLHTATISHFYHQLDSRVGRAVTERTAEFLALLDESLRAARALRN
ncbi:hypothetical protein QBC35DRAFT_445821 [Podospora australis]|uniref:Uncharacterized protein n=1 Tax=Podospora australis TaxID=1536484 RepID=A0AAN7AD09_9PEZI|nr:hypothetical protein QBC35DRAFT_445821 [Podospora australis]